MRLLIAKAVAAEARRFGYAKLREEELLMLSVRFGNQLKRKGAAGPMARRPFAFRSVVNSVSSRMEMEDFVHDLPFSVNFKQSK
jgi:hypothetical protein